LTPCGNDSSFFLSLHGEYHSGLYQLDTTVSTAASVAESDLAHTNSHTHKSCNAQFNGDPVQVQAEQPTATKIQLDQLRESLLSDS